MTNQRFTYLKSFLIPCLFFQISAGIGTGIVIFLFKLASSKIISLSSELYRAVRANPSLLPLLLGGAAVLGAGAALLTHRFPDCKGGGIPASIALLRGLVTFRWLRCLLSVFASAMLTYLGGVPLGNEGPSVQMGTAVGRGVAAKFPAWRRYVMTGGAAAGFAAATGAPLTGILFAFEEAHRRFSPLLFLSASISAITASAVMKVLCSISNIPYTLFHFDEAAPLPIRLWWVPIVIGLVVGLSAALFTQGYRLIRRFMKDTLKRLPYGVKITAIFVLTALAGFFFPDCIGSGHDPIENLMGGHGTAGFLLLLFVIRALLLLCANNADITGGLFVPTLALGALLGGICGNLLDSIGLLPQEFRSLAVIMGISAFLSASSRTPLMALAFASEVLGAGANLLPIAIGGTIAFLCIETTGIPDFCDIVVEAKTEAAHHGKASETMELNLTVAPHSFVDGKEIRDILWPPSCTILSVKRSEAVHTHGGTGMGAGDELRIHVRTYSPTETLRDLEALVGKQSDLS